MYRKSAIVFVFFPSVGCKFLVQQCSNNENLVKDIQGLQYMDTEVYKMYNFIFFF